MSKYLAIQFVSAFLFTVYSQWINTGMLTGTGTQFPSVSVVNDSVVWVAGGNAGVPVIYRSINSGTNFSAVNPPPCFELTCIYALSADECISGDGGSSGYNGGNAKLFRTTNAGVNWVLVNQTGGTNGFFNDVVFSKTNPLDGIAASKPPAGTGQPYYILKTIDGGNNWTVQNPPGISGSNGVWHCVFIYDNTAYGFSITGGFLPRLYGTTTGGSTWQALPLLITGNPVTSFAFSTINPIALASTASVVARTTDQGVTWQTVNNGGAACIKWIPGTTTCYFMDAGVIKKSTDEGFTWNTMTIPAIGLRHFDFAVSGNNVYGFCIAGDGTVIKLTESLTGIKIVNENIPGRFELFQNYPNPFNPNTVILFQLAAGGFTSLKIYNSEGQEIRTLVNETLKPGKYEIVFDGSAVSSGAYYYRIIAGDFRKTRKMIVLK